MLQRVWALGSCTWEAGARRQSGGVKGQTFTLEWGWRGQRLQENDQISALGNLVSCRWGEKAKLPMTGNLREQRRIEASGNLDPWEVGAFVLCTAQGSRGRSLGGSHGPEEPLRKPSHGIDCFPAPSLYGCVSLGNTALAFGHPSAV